MQFSSVLFGRNCEHCYLKSFRYILSMELTEFLPVRVIKHLNPIHNFTSPNFFSKSEGIGYD